MPLYLDTARFGSILPECAEMLREFATLLEYEGQFPLFDEFLHHGSASWSDKLTSRFPTLARWLGLPALRQRILTLCGVQTPATVLFASASRHLARVAFQMLSHRCERVLCCDADWPDFQEMLRKQLVQSGGCLRHVQLTDRFRPEEDHRNRELRLAAAWKEHRCDGALITAVSANGYLTRVDRLIDEISKTAGPRYLVVDGAQQAGHVPIELGPGFHGVYLAGTHKWLRSGVPLSFGVFVHGNETSDTNMPIRKAIRLSLVDDSLLLQTANVDLEQPRQTMRLEPLLAASLAIEHALNNRVAEMLQVRRRNVQTLFEIARDTPLSLGISCRQGILHLMLESSRFTSDEIQQHFAKEGLKLSVRKDRGEHGIRISCPATDFTSDEINDLWRIFSKLAQRYGDHHQACSDPDGIHSFA